MLQECFRSLLIGYLCGLVTRRASISPDKSAHRLQRASRCRSGCDFRKCPGLRELQLWEANGHSCNEITSGIPRNLLGTTQTKLAYRLLEEEKCSVALIPKTRITFQELD